MMNDAARDSSPGRFVNAFFNAASNGVVSLTKMLNCSVAPVSTVA